MILIEWEANCRQARKNSQKAQSKKKLAGRGGMHTVPPYPHLVVENVGHHDQPQPFGVLGLLQGNSLATCFP